MSFKCNRSNEKDDDEENDGEVKKGQVWRSVGTSSCTFVRRLLQKAVFALREVVDYIPKGIALSRVYETPHPYLDNMDITWHLHFPGASRIKIVFDPRSYTETNCDWIAFFK